MSDNFRESKEWTPSDDIPFDTNTSREEAKMSFSGHERNRLFLNKRGQAFSDYSAISGLDSEADGRGFVLWDYDRDGWQDIALVNSNSPSLNLFHNEIGYAGESGDVQENQVIAVRFVGGNDSARPLVTAACRDGYGAVVEVTLGDLTLKREHRCGEGFATQNSATMLIGIGQRHRVERVTVRWPAGEIHEIEDVPAGTLLTCFENESHAPEGTPFSLESYRIEWPAIQPIASLDYPVLKLTTLSVDSPEESRLRLYTTMATWCAACKAQIPQLQQLRRACGEKELVLYGLPIDPTDDHAKLDTYIQQWDLPYELIVALTNGQRKAVKQVLSDTGHAEILPVTIVTNKQNEVLHVFAGVPTVSEVKKLLDPDVLPLQLDNYRLRINNAIRLQKEGELVAAVEQLKIAMEIRPNEYEVHAHLGFVYKQLQELTLAIRHFRRSLEMGNEDYSIHGHLGELLFVQKDFDDAVEQFRQLIIQKPDFADGFFSLARALMGKGDPESAEQALRKAIRLNADYVNAHGFLGDLLAERSDWSGAIGHYKNIVRVVPQHVTAHFRLGQIYEQARQFGKSAKYFRRTVELDPDHGPAKKGLKRVARQLGRGS